MEEVKPVIAFVDASDQINLTIPGFLRQDTDKIDQFTVLSGDMQLEIAEVGVQVDGSSTRVRLILAEKIDLTRNYEIIHPDYQSCKAVMRKVLDEDKYLYSGDDLGPTYTSERTYLRVWAPTANRVEVILYAAGDALVGNHFEMEKDIQGTWYLELNGDLKNKFYTYLVHVHGLVREAVDPYAKSVNVNGTKGAIIDLNETNPRGWQETERPKLEKYVDAIIYESHIRDLSMAASSGIVNRGKYLALTEENTESHDGFTTGLAHLKELGITHLHLLPIMESEFIIDDQNKYNWGYGTNFFFATEGQYVTDPANPVLRVKEFKKLVMVLHKNGIRIVLDVVYNHLGRFDADLERIVPGYYLRRDEQWNLFCGSGVNNDFASERPMARKLMLDSLKYWVEEYRVDGYRFDLMGLHDQRTMLQGVREVHAIDPSILFYGEAWYLSTGLPYSELMVKNSQQGTPIGIFNDNVRDVVVSGGLSPVTERGFASGKREIESGIKKAVVGSIINYDPVNVYNVEYQKRSHQEIIHTLAPHESINYVTSHDNYALRDRLDRSNPEATEEEKEKMAMLANGIILTCQGIPFLAGGVEIHKTKFGDENSYQSSDYINEIDWSYKTRYYQMFKFYQGLIRLRKEHPAFRMTTAEEIINKLVFFDSPSGTVAFSINDYANGDSWRSIVVIYNQNNSSEQLKLPGSDWMVVVKAEQAGIRPLEKITGDSVQVPPIGMMVLYQN